MRFFHTGFWFGLAVPASVLAFGIEAKAASQAPAAAKAQSNSGLEYFLGGWDIVATTPGSDAVTRFTYEVQPWLRPHWLSGHGRSSPPGEESRDVWGRDSASGELMRMIVTDNGTYAIVRSSGWQGSKLVLEGDARSERGVVRVRETIERIDDHNFVATWEAYRNGTWSAYSIERVTRRLGATSSS